MYTNIPIQELTDIINYLCIHNNIEPTTRTELQKICNIVLTQNYFRFNNIQSSQTQGLAMGATSSSILSEIYLLFLKNIQIYNILIQHQIIGYFCYVDNILIVYSNNNTDIHKVLDLFNKISPTLTFTIEKEQNNCINFLNISICKNQNISYIVYRKPTATNIIIPKDSNHPPEHKQAAIRYLANQLVTYPLNNMNKEKEYDNIKQILINNKYDTQILNRTIKTLNTKTTTRHNSPTTLTQPKMKRATFTYVGPQTKYIAKLFKHTNVNIVFKTNNTFGYILITPTPTPTIQATNFTKAVYTN